MSKQSPTLGESFASVIAVRDRDGLMALLADDIDFIGLTPGRTWTASTPAEVDAIVFGAWFEESDHVGRVATVQVNDDVGDTAHVGYRFELDLTAGSHVVEQQAYYRTDGDKINYLRILCSGFRPR